MDTNRAAVGMLVTVSAIVKKYLEPCTSRESNVYLDDLPLESSDSDSESEAGDVSCDTAEESNIELNLNKFKLRMSRMLY